MQFETEHLGINFISFYPLSHIFRWGCYCHWGVWLQICLRNVCRRSLLITEVLRSGGTRCFRWDLWIFFFIQSSHSYLCLSYKLQFCPTMHGGQFIKQTGSKASVSKRFFGATPPSIIFRVHNKWFCLPFKKLEWWFWHQGRLLRNLL